MKGPEKYSHHQKYVLLKENEKWGSEPHSFTTTPFLGKTKFRTAKGSIFMLGYQTNTIIESVEKNS